MSRQGMGLLTGARDVTGRLQGFVWQKQVGGWRVRDLASGRRKGS